MADFTYTVKRSIRPGHVLDDIEIITVGLRDLDRVQKRIISENKALSGVTATILHRIEYKWVVMTALVTKASGTPGGEDLREFLDSVSGGETFTFDDGTAITMILDDGDWRESREEPLHYRYKFTMLEV